MQIVHNIGAGPKMEDVLFGWKLTGHYRYEGPKGEAERQETNGDAEVKQREVKKQQAKGKVQK
jgi:hypothetical protein